MSEGDRTLDLLCELRDVGVTLPPEEMLHARVASAIADEIEHDGPPSAAGFDEGALERSPSELFARTRRHSARLTAMLLPAVGVLVVAVVIAIFIGLRSSGPSTTSPTPGSVEFVFAAQPSAQTPLVTRAALERTAAIIRQRLNMLGIAPANVYLSGTGEITVILHNVRDTARAEQAVSTTAQLAFYDWEANVLTPNGKSVASQLAGQDPLAIDVSQGAPGSSPGSPGAGGLGLYRAVLLASKQPYSAIAAASRVGSQYYMFGAPGSAACATAAHEDNHANAAGDHCLLSGPEPNLPDLDAGLPAGITPQEGQVLVVKRGTVVLEATAADYGRAVPLTAPNARFFVLRDNVALRNSDLTNPRPSRDPNTGSPDVTLGFSVHGRTAFQKLTAGIARRGELDSSIRRTLSQHLAVALDGQLITVPDIDFKADPDGVSGANGADITGGLTPSSARGLATELRLGPLPLSLTLICGSAPATTPCHA